MKQVGMILLAAGSSKRYGGIKLLEQIQGKQMYLSLFDNVSYFPNCPKVVVTQYDEIYEKALTYGYTPIRNRKPELGISHSIQYVWYLPMWN